MKKENLIVSVVLILVILINCQNSTNSTKDILLKESLSERSPDNLYVVTPSAHPHRFVAAFNVKNIHTDVIDSVGGVLQTDDYLYYPLLSSIPNYNNKIVKGFFIEDTTYIGETTGNVFRVTEHVRDTSLGYYSQD